MRALRLPVLRSPAWGVVILPLVGGAAATLVEQNLLIGAVVYYALLALAVVSPQAASLRRAAFSRIATPRPNLEEQSIGSPEDVER